MLQAEIIEILCLNTLFLNAYKVVAHNPCVYKTSRAREICTCKQKFDHCRKFSAQLKKQDKPCVKYYLKMTVDKTVFNLILTRLFYLV